MTPMPRNGTSDLTFSLLSPERMRNEEYDALNAEILPVGFRIGVGFNRGFGHDPSLRCSWLIVIDSEGEFSTGSVLSDDVRLGSD